MPAIVGILQRRQSILAFAGFGLSSLGFFPNGSLAQQPQTGNPVAPTTTPPAGQYVGSFIDPRTGKQYDRYWELANVPMPRYEQQEVTERRMVPQWVTENIKTTEVRYVPTIEYQPQQRVLNRWNPMAQPQVALEYVPVTRYQPIYEVVDRPYQYQKYVEQEVKVLIPKLVEATQSQMKLVDRERTPTTSQTAGAPNAMQNAAEIAMANRNSQAPRYTTRPIDGWYSGSQAPSALYPYSPYGAYVASVPSSPYYGHNYAGSPALLPGGAGPVLPMTPYRMPQTQLVSNQTLVPPVGYAYPNTYPPAYVAPNMYASTKPTFAWPSWSNNNGPLFRQDWFRQNQASPYAYGSQPTGAYNYPMMASQSEVNGTLRPSTAPLLPQGQPATWGNNSLTQAPDWPYC